MKNKQQELLKQKKENECNVHGRYDEICRYCLHLLAWQKTCDHKLFWKNIYFHKISE